MDIASFTQRDTIKEANKFLNTAREKVHFTFNSRLITKFILWGRDRDQLKGGVEQGY